MILLCDVACPIFTSFIFKPTSILSINAEFGYKTLKCGPNVCPSFFNKFTWESLRASFWCLKMIRISITIGLNVLLFSFILSIPNWANGRCSKRNPDMRKLFNQIKFSQFGSVLRVSPRLRPSKCVKFYLEKRFL